MKKAIMITAFAFSALTGKAQNSSTKLKLHAANAGFGIYLIDKINNDGGLSFLADATFSINKNLISASCVFGSEFTVIGDTKYDFTEPALLYGREWKPVKWFALEGFAGVGYYVLKYSNYDTDFETLHDKAISFPLRLNTKFYFSEHFGMGLNTNYSINSLSNTTTINLMFHYRFN